MAVELTGRPPHIAPPKKGADIDEIHVKCASNGFTVRTRKRGTEAGKKGESTHTVYARKKDLLKYFGDSFDD